VIGTIYYEFNENTFEDDIWDLKMSMEAYYYDIVGPYEDSLAFKILMDRVLKYIYNQAIENRYLDKTH
jgi:hypothetical protein